MKHTPSAAETLDSLTQGASLFLDPSGAQVGEEVQGEEGIAYANLDLNACIEPKQLHDTVGYYQRFDVFDLRVDRRRQGPETAFQADVEVVTGEVPSDTRRLDNQRVSSNKATHGIGGLRMM